MDKTEILFWKEKEDEINIIKLIDGAYIYMDDLIEFKMNVKYESGECEEFNDLKKLHYSDLIDSIFVTYKDIDDMFEFSIYDIVEIELKNNTKITFLDEIRKLREN